MSAIETFDPEQVYDTVATNYDRATSTFWPHVALNAIRLARPRPGDRVLDVACGPGDLALHAAKAVGAHGSVTGLDVSSQMLAIARRRARDANLSIDFRVGDMDAIPFHPSSFDVLTCGFGLFFSPHVPSTLSRFWDLLRPGGRLVVVTLTNRFFSPLFDVFLDAAGRESDTELQSLMPWRLTENPEVMRQRLHEVGAVDPHVMSDDALLVIDGPGTWDLIESGTGIQRIVAEIGPAAAARARNAVHDYIRAHDVRAIHFGAVYAAATRSD